MLEVQMDGKKEEQKVSRTGREALYYWLEGERTKGVISGLPFSIVELDPQ